MTGLSGKRTRLNRLLFAFLIARVIPREEMGTNSISSDFASDPLKFYDATIS
jgi:hypothetical protein